jgi:hypothetical protein
VCDRVTVRQCAALYIGSFIGRALYLDHRVRSLALHRLAEFARDYRHRVPAAAARPSARLHAPYYAAVQAMLYAMCFMYAQLASQVADCAATVLASRVHAHTTREIARSRSHVGASASCWRAATLSSCQRVERSRRAHRLARRRGDARRRRRRRRQRRDRVAACRTRGGGHTDARLQSTQSAIYV